MRGITLVEVTTVAVVVLIGLLVCFVMLRPGAQRISRWQRWCLWVAGVTVSFRAIGAALYNFDPGSILGMSLTGFIAGIIAMLVWKRPVVHHNFK